MAIEIIESELEADEKMTEEERGIFVHFHDIKQFPLLTQAQTRSLFQELEEKHVALRKIIARYPVGVAEIIRRGKAAATSGELLRNLVTMPLSTMEEVKKSRAAVKKMIRRLERLENQATSQGRMKYLDTFVSLLSDLSLEPMAENEVLQVVEAFLQQKSMQNGAGGDSKNNLAILRQERDQLKEIRDTIVSSNLRLVAGVAHCYKNRYSFNDLMQEGSIGLMRAAEKYDWRQGYLFSTYSVWWVRQAILRVIQDRKRIIYVPVHMQEKWARLQRRENSLTQLIGRNPSEEELARFSGSTVEEIKIIRESMIQPTCSLDKTIAGGGSAGDAYSQKFSDLLADENAENPEDAAAKEKLRALENRLLETLTPREEKIVRMRFGLGEKREYTLEEIGAEFAVTRECIRQVEAVALQKLRGTIEQAGIREDLIDLSGKQRESFAKFCEKMRQLKCDLEKRGEKQSRIIREVLAEVASRHELPLMDLLRGIPGTKKGNLLPEAEQEAIVILHDICACFITQIAHIFNLQFSMVEKQAKLGRAFLQAQETIQFS